MVQIILIRNLIFKVMRTYITHHRLCKGYMDENPG